MHNKENKIENIILECYHSEHNSKNFINTESGKTYEK